MMKAANGLRFNAQVCGALFALVMIACAGRVAMGAVDAFDRGAWQNFTNIDMVMGLAAAGDTVWMATTGGIAYLPSSESSQPTRLTNREGLGDNDLRFVMRADDAAIWAGGLNGRLSRRWTDVAWSTYPFIREDAGIPLNAAASGPDGFLWVASDAGLHKFDTERNGGEIKETYTRIGAWGSSEVSDVLVSAGRVWVVGDAGIATADVTDPFLLDPARWISWTSVTSVRTVAAFAGTIYVGSESGLWRLEPNGANLGDGTWVSAGAAQTHVDDLFSAGDTLWVATEKGIALCTNGICLGPPLSGTLNRRMTSVTRSADGTVWFGLERGILRWKGGDYSTTEFNGPLDNDIVDVAVGHDGKIWCVHPTTGVDYLEDGIWTSLPYVKLFVSASGPATSVDIAPDGKVWIGAWGGGAFVVNPANPQNDWTHFDTTNSALTWVTDPGGPNSYVVVRDVVVDQAGHAWFANAFADQGVRLVFNDNGCWGQFGTSEGIGSDNLAVLYALDHSVLIGFGNSGLAEYEYPTPLCVGSEPVSGGGRITFRNTNDGLPSDQVQSILVDRADSLWVGTTAGLVQWIPDLRRFFNVPLPADAGLSINALAADAFNTLWVGTTRGLVTRSSSGATEFFDQVTSPLVGNDVRELAVDDQQGVLWVATGSGLSRVVTGAAPADNVEDVLAFPNPFEITFGSNQEVRFNAPFGSQIYIYTVSGDLVIDIPASQGWDGRNRNGEMVASGIYLFVVRGPNGDYGRGKLAVIHRL